MKGGESICVRDPICILTASSLLILAAALLSSNRVSIIQAAVRFALADARPFMKSSAA